MTDRKLLELAAKAGEYEFAVDAEGTRIKEHGHWRWWNPLTDDGDALRLAVNLRMDILMYDDRVGCGIDLENMSGSLTADDPYAATRRAIVRAAAEIGRGL